MTLALVSLNQTLYDKEVTNVLGFDGVQETASWLQEFADDIRAAWDGSPKDNQVADWILEGITVSFIQDDEITHSVNVNFTAGQLIGDAPEGGLPTTNALLTSLNFIGPRPNRGRIYFTGFGEAAQDNSAWDSEVRSDFKAMVEVWKNGIGPLGEEAQLVIMRRPGDAGPVYVANPVDTVTSRLHPATQRRRRLGS